MTIVGKKKVKIDREDGNWFNINTNGTDIQPDRYIMNKENGWIYDLQRRKLKFNMISGGKKIVVEKGVTEKVNLVTINGKNKNYILEKLYDSTFNI